MVLTFLCVNPANCIVIGGTIVSSDEDIALLDVVRVDRVEVVALKLRFVLQRGIHPA